jgi:HSP20 family protein
MFIVPVTRDSRALSALAGRDLSRLFDDTFERFFNTTNGSEAAAARAPALDVVETDSGYAVKLDMPGVAKEDVKIAVEGRQVSVQAETTRVEEKKDGERLLYRERAASRYARTFTLPVEVDQGEAAARLEHGVLTLTLPKRNARSAAQIPVN